eukprot:11169095-Lingulodinium_polyedra.AAC.1
MAMPLLLFFCYHCGCTDADGAVAPVATLAGVVPLRRLPCFALSLQLLVLLLRSCRGCRSGRVAVAAMLL